MESSQLQNLRYRTHHDINVIQERSTSASKSASDSSYDDIGLVIADQVGVYNNKSISAQQKQMQPVQAKDPLGAQPS